jgi:hypothetical protein
MGYLGRRPGGWAISVYTKDGRPTALWYGPTGAPVGAGSWGLVTIEVQDGQLVPLGSGGRQMPARLDPDAGTLRTLKPFSELAGLNVTVVAAHPIPR